MGARSAMVNAVLNLENVQYEGGTFQPYHTRIGLNLAGWDTINITKRFGLRAYKRSVTVDDFDESIQLRHCSWATVLIHTISTVAHTGPVTFINAGTLDFTNGPLGGNTLTLVGELHASRHGQPDHRRHAELDRQVRHLWSRRDQRRRHLRLCSGKLQLGDPVLPDTPPRGSAEPSPRRSRPTCRRGSWRASTTHPPTPSWCLARPR